MPEPEKLPVETRSSNPPDDGSIAAVYSGFTGAAVYAGLILAATLFSALAASAVLGTMADSGEVAAAIFLRILVFGGATAVAAGLSRWIAGGQTNRLLSLKMVGGDWGGIAGLIVGLFIAGAWASGPANARSDGSTIELGDQLDFEGPVLDGGRWNLADHRGKVVLIDFWATWCPPCVAELPFVRQAFEKYHREGFEVVAVSLDSSRESLESFLKEHSEPWPQIFSEPPEDNPLAARYKVEAIPFLLLVGRDGKVSAVDIRGNQIDHAVAAALKGEPYTPSPFGEGGVLGVVSLISNAVLWSPWWLLASAILVCSTAGAALEGAIRRGAQNRARG